MARFVPKREEQIFAQMLAKVLSRTELSDVADSSTIKHSLRAASRGDGEIFYQLSLLLLLFSIDDAKDDDLDERAKDIQPAVVTRTPAQNATGNVVFSRSTTTGTITIRKGTKVKTGDNQVFTTTATGSITPASAERVSGHGVGRDSGLVPVVADVAGSAGNVSASTVTKFVTKPAGVDEVTNLTVFAQGRDKESDDSFRSRLKNYVKGLARSTALAIEAGLIAKEDPDSGATILFTKVVEDIVDLGYSTAYIDDGTGQVESIEQAHEELSATYTWNGTTTVTTADTSEVEVGDWIRLVVDGQWFEITSIVTNTSVTVLNPGSDTIPSGATVTAQATDILTQGFSPTDDALGGETELQLNDYPVKDTLPVNLATDVAGNLVKDTDYTLDPTSGKIVLTTALVTGEKVVGATTYYTGLIAYAQKIVNGDRNDRTNFPGLKAAGTRVQVSAPNTLIESVAAVVTVNEGYERSTVLANVRQAIKDYVNTLTISGDLKVSQLYKAITAVPGVTDVEITDPVANVLALDNQMIRTQDSVITVT